MLYYKSNLWRWFREWLSSPIPSHSQKAIPIPIPFPLFKVIFVFPSIITYGISFLSISISIVGLSDRTHNFISINIDNWTVAIIMMIDDHGNSFSTLQPWEKMGFHGHKTYNNIIQYGYHSIILSLFRKKWWKITLLVDLVQYSIDYFVKNLWSR